MCVCLLFTLDLASATQCCRITSDGDVDGAALTPGVVTSLAIRIRKCIMDIYK